MAWELGAAVEPDLVELTVPLELLLLLRLVLLLVKLLLIVD